MAHRHPLDPPDAWAMAERAGKLAAQGIIQPADFRDKMMPGILARGFQGDEHGLALRLLWHMNDVAEHWRRERDRCEWAMRRHLAPMILEWADAEDIEQTARYFNEAAGSPLLGVEVKALVDGELAAALRLRGRPAKVRRRAR